MTTTQTAVPAPTGPTPTQLDPRLAALVRLKLEVSVTHLHEEGIRRCVREALDAGATSEEILQVIQLSTVIGVHAMAKGVPILQDILDGEGHPPVHAQAHAPTPVTDGLQRRGAFNPAWRSIAQVAPDWLEAFLATSLPIWRDGPLPPAWIELLCVAGDASITHRYDAGTARHIRAALELGVDSEVIVAVLQIVADQASEALSSGRAILAEQLTEYTEGNKS